MKAPKPKLASVPERDSTKYLLSIICLVSASLTVAVYFLLSPGSGVKELALHVIPHAFFALIAIPVIYFLLESRGIIGHAPHGPQASKDLESIITQIIDDKIGSLKVHPAVLEFFPCWSEVNWGKYIADSKKIEIIVHYFSSWTADNLSPLVDVLNHGGTITLILSSPNDPNCVAEVQKVYPEHSPETIKQKLLLTVSRFQSVQKKSKATEDSLKVYYYAGRLNYCAVRFDETRLFLGFYEHFREHRVASSAIVLDLTKSEHLEKFWKRQFSEFIDKSVKAF